MEKKPIKILALSDQVVSRIYNQNNKIVFSDIDLVISCGDLPYYYLEFIIDSLNVPLYFVHGNHDPVVEISDNGEKSAPWGATNLHRKFKIYNDLIFLGFEGSIRYSNARYQFTQLEVWLQIIEKVPRLIWNKLIHGRALDVLVTHSPAYQIGDQSDPAHIGFKAYRWLIKTFRPAYHLHGHIHIYDNQGCAPIKFGDTTVINACPYRLVEISGGKKHEKR